MAATDPTISVLMPVYNAERYLREAVESVLGQTFADFELIAVDDGSTDGSLAILREYERRDGRVRVISRPNTGIVGALNDGLALCRGEYVARMDADDVCMPERLERQVKVFESRSGLVLLGTGARYTDPELWPVRDTRPTVGNDLLVRRLLSGDGLALLHPTVMIRADAIRKIGGYDPSYPISEDLDLYLRLSEIGEVDNLPQLLLLYRMHVGSITNRPNRAVEFACRARDEALRRRGICGELATTPPAASVKATGGQESKVERWAWWAWMDGFKGTARKYARRALWGAPLSREAWKLLLVTHLKRPPKVSG